MKALVAVLPGDGIGPEVTEQAVRVLERIGELSEHQIDLHEESIGAEAIAQHGASLPQKTYDLCCAADAILLGAVGSLGATSDGPRAEEGLLLLRKGLELYINLRPVRSIPALAGSSPLKREIVIGVDLVFVRELTGGLYFGRKQRDNELAIDECVYTRREVERTIRAACEVAQRRSRRVTSVDKANVLETSRLWRQTAEQVVAEEYPDVSLDHLLVDAAAMHLITRPADFDVIVTENMFGDILSDEASVLTGSLGMLPSASLGAGRAGLYEPVHGSAPDIAGEGIANPYGAILSVAMLLRHSLDLEKEASIVEEAVAAAVEAGMLTADLLRIDGDISAPHATTAEAGEAVVKQVERFFEP